MANPIDWHWMRQIIEKLVQGADLTHEEREALFDAWVQDAEGYRIIHADVKYEAARK
jgi:anthranilate phosphoribosyltransferase